MSALVYGIDAHLHECPRDYDVTGSTGTDSTRNGNNVCCCLTTPTSEDPVRTEGLDSPFLGSMLPWLGSWLTAACIDNPYHRQMTKTENSGITREAENAGSALCVGSIDHTTKGVRLGLERTRAVPQATVHDCSLLKIERRTLRKPRRERLMVEHGG